MIVLEARNVNYALPQGVDFIHRAGLPEPSRAGDVLRVPYPVTTVYENPVERVCLHPWRDANPFFHLIEAMWMLAGRSDLKPLTNLVSTFVNYSDDGVTVPGAYGERWRNWGEPLLDPHSGAEVGRNELWPDQLDWVVKRLRADPRDRRVVIQMWDPGVDPARADAGSKDVPCNLTVLPFVTDGALNITVFCRSNDMVWGAYGANAVQFSVLLEYLACRIGLQVGKYYQVSNNFHAYVETAGDPEACWPVAWAGVDPYARGELTPYPLDHCFPLSDHLEAGIGNRNERLLREDLRVFFEHGPAETITKARWPFLKHVVAPMALAHQHWKTKKGEDRFLGALDILAQLPPANDWRRAGEDWINRRFANWQKKETTR